MKNENKYIIEKVKKDAILYTQVENYDNGIVSLDSKSDLLNLIYDSSLSLLDTMRLLNISSEDGINANIELKGDKLPGAIKLPEGSVDIPSGEYINIDDFVIAFKKLCENEKKITFSFRGDNRKYKLSKNKINKFKKDVDLCSSIKLQIDKGKRTFDLINIFGKRANLKSFDKKQIGILYNINPKLEGIYVSKSELISKEKRLIVKKRLQRLEALLERKSKKELENRTYEDNTMILIPPKDKLFGYNDDPSDFTILTDPDYLEDIKTAPIKRK